MSNEDDNYRSFGDSCSGVYPPEEFEGLWVENWPNGQLKFRGQFKKNRRRVGQHLSFWESGALQELSYWDDGWVCGTLVRFGEDGTRECEKDYGEHGGRTRSWTERCYSLDGELYSLFVWKNGDIIARWTRPELRKIEEQIGFNKIIQDAVKMVYPNE